MKQGHGERFADGEGFSLARGHEWARFQARAFAPFPVPVEPP